MSKSIFKLQTSIPNEILWWYHNRALHKQMSTKINEFLQEFPYREQLLLIIASKGGYTGYEKGSIIQCMNLFTVSVLHV